MDPRLTTTDGLADYSLVLFDGVCNFCNFWVKFIYQRDKHASFRFASLQSEAALPFLKHFEMATKEIDSVVLIENGQCYTESTAALRICRKLDGAWKLLYALMVVPMPLRDGVYRFVAKRRYRLFGKQMSCMLPTERMRERFLAEEVVTKNESISEVDLLGG